MHLCDALATTKTLSEIFSDQSILRTMLEFEVALAKVEARLKIIPESAATAIASAASPNAFDLSALSQEASRSGTLVVPFSKALAEIVGKQHPDAAGFVHWGATSQDVSDTTLVLLLKRAIQVIVADLNRIESALRTLSEKHRNSIMLGRTLMQPATPITFGLKAAGWFASVHRCRVRLEHACEEALVLQFGGAAGTLAALGDLGAKVSESLAKELGLPLPDAPWHTHRDRLATALCACGVLVGSLGKIARDISLMSQSEIAELSEPVEEGRGGSSTMPHKRNPVGCAIALAAATRVPALVSSYLSAMVQEHERGVGGSQAEWPIAVDIVQATGAAASSIAEVSEGLIVDSVRMQDNLRSTKGTVFAEKASMLLSKRIGKSRAHKLLELTTRKALEQNKSLADALRELPEARECLDETALTRLDAPEDYLGAAEWFRKRLLENPTDRSEDKKD